MEVKGEGTVSGCNVTSGRYNISSTAAQIINTSYIGLDCIMRGVTLVGGWDGWVTLVSGWVGDPGGWDGWVTLVGGGVGWGGMGGWVGGWVILVGG